MNPENPPGAIARIEIEQAAFHNGWRIADGVQGGWFYRRSTRAPGTVAVAGAGRDGPWFLAVDHSGVADELDFERTNMPGPGVARFVLDDTGALHRALGRAWELALSLPDHPLRVFREQTEGLPRGTEAERLVIQRKGQDVFRGSLMGYWGYRCPLTGITDPGLLRASHMKPWAQCETDAERLDPYNGILLSALWDAAFDTGLISFDEGGHVLRSPKLTDIAQATLSFAESIEFTGKHHVYLAWHRNQVFRNGSE